MKDGNREVKKTFLQRKRVAKEIKKNKTKKTTWFQKEGKRKHKGTFLSLKDQQFFSTKKKGQYKRKQFKKKHGFFL